MREFNFYTYIMASNSGTLYIGVTRDLARRISEHKQGLIKGFTLRYGCKKLVYYEHYSDIRQAITREKELKGWLRKKKEDLIRTINPKWKDLSEEWD